MRTTGSSRSAADHQRAAAAGARATTPAAARSSTAIASRVARLRALLDVVGAPRRGGVLAGEHRGHARVRADPPARAGAGVDGLAHDRMAEAELARCRTRAPARRPAARRARPAPPARRARPRRWRAPARTARPRPRRRGPARARPASAPPARRRARRAPSRARRPSATARRGRAGCRRRARRRRRAATRARRAAARRPRRATAGRASRAAGRPAPAAAARTPAAGRNATTTSSGVRIGRRARWAISSTDAGSAQWASSTISSTGAPVGHPLQPRADLAVIAVALGGQHAARLVEELGERGERDVGLELRRRSAQHRPRRRSARPAPRAAASCRSPARRRAPPRLSYAASSPSSRSRPISLTRDSRRRIPAGYSDRQRSGIHPIDPGSWSRDLPGPCDSPSLSSPPRRP